MKQSRRLPGIVFHAALWAGFLGLFSGAHAQTGSGQALVIGEATYASFPSLPGCALSAHAVAAALRGLGFAVDEQNDGSSGALYAAIGTLNRQRAAAPQIPAFVYFCGYASSFDDRPFVLPVSASIVRPADVLTQGLLAKTLLNAATGDVPAAGILVLDTVPVPNGPAVPPLDALLQPALPPTFGYIAAITSAPGNTPTPMASALVPLLRGSAITGASLLTAVQRQMADMKTATVAALHVPDAELGLMSAAPRPAEAVAVPAQPRAAASPAPAAKPSPPIAATAPSLPDEEQMTEDQRRLVQRALAHLGYYDARTDGVFGSETRAAIRRWQHEVHTPMTGHLSAGEANRLAASWD